MSDVITLKGKIRTENGKAVNKLREAGLIPAVLYGHGISNQSLAINAVDLDKVYEQAGESSLVDLVIDDAKPVKVLLHDMQYDPLTHRVSHADLYQVRMDEEISTSISLVMVGESPAVKNLGAMMVTALEELETKCLPGALVKEIKVDVSGLANIDDKITVGQLNVPAGITVLTPANFTVVIIAEVKQEAEAPIAAPAEGATPVAGAAPAEGATPAADAKAKPEKK